MTAGAQGAWVTLCAVGAALCAAAPADAAGPDQREHGRAYYDAREASGDRPARVPAGTLRARGALGRTLGREGIVHTDPATGTPRTVARLDGFLTRRSRAEAADVVFRYIREHAGVFGLAESDLDRLRLTRRERTPDGVTHLLWAQTDGGIPVAGSGLRASVAADGRLVNVLGGPRPGLRANTLEPALTATEALALARDAAGAARAAAPRATTQPGPERETAFAGGDDARLVLYDSGGERARLAWRLTVTASSTEVYDAIVDAQSGRLLRRENLVLRFQQGLAWDNHPGAAAGGVATSRDLAPYLTESTRLIGDNAHVFADVDDDDLPGPGEEIPADANTDWSYAFTPVAAPFGACPASGCSWNGGVADSWQANLRQNATQVFWFVNRFHDHLATSPAAFNQFQGSSKVIVHTSDGAAGPGGTPDDAHRNNANFTATTPPRIQMYLWSGNGYSDVNGGDDAGIVYHEYAHGISTRLITDSTGRPALQSAQAGAMGEGWSDYYALDYLVSQGHMTDTAKPGEVFIGAYVDGGRGLIRHQAIDCTLGAPATDCPAPDGPGGAAAGAGGFAYDDFAKIGSGGAEVHDDGEIWAQTLWDLRTRLIADHGSVLGAGRTLQIVTEAMRLSPDDPSFLDMRNAILQADTVLNGGADHDAIWAVFARRGMGYFASTIDGTDREPVASFSLPPDANADTGTLTGTLVDQDSDAPVSGAQAYLGGHFSQFASDHADTSADGSYSIPDVPVGTYPHLIVSAPGYQQKIERRVTVSAGFNTRDLRLRRNWADIGGGAAVVPAVDPNEWIHGCTPSEALDGSGRTSMSAVKTPAPVVTIQLPEPVAVTGFGVDPGAGCGDDDTASTGAMTIQVSTNGTDFDTVATPTFTPGDNHKLTNVAPDTSAWDVTHVRFRLDAPQGQVGRQRGSSHQSFVDISEFQVYASVNERPVARFTFAPEDPQTDDDVTFDATTSSDPDPGGEIVRHEWDLDGDGGYETDTGRTPTVNHSYRHPGPVTVRLRVTDDRGDTGVHSEQVIVVTGAEIYDLGELPGSAAASAGGVNRYGTVAGNSSDATLQGGLRAWRYEGGQIGELPGLGSEAVAYGLNNDNTAVGWAELVDGTTQRAVTWDADGTVHPLATLPDHEDAYSIGRGINEAGTVAGEGVRRVPDGQGEAEVVHAMRWEPGGGLPQDLGTLHADPEDPDATSAAYDVNAFGHIVGWARNGSGEPQRAVLWDSGGTATDLGTLGGPESHADAISTFGEVVGWAQTSARAQRPFLYANGRMRNLGTLGGAAGAARDISPGGELVVGWGEDSANVSRAFLWRDGELAALNRYLPEGSGWSNLEVANGVNDGGQIVGYGTKDGQERAYLLDIGECELCVEKVEFEQRDVPSGDWVPVTSRGTVDGNVVRVTATITNKGSEHAAMNVKFIDTHTRRQLPDSLQPPDSLPPGETITHSYEWDTQGLAWDGETAVPFRPVRVELTVGNTIFDSRTKSLRIAPKPIVAVHGLNSGADTWGSYAAFAEAAHDNWEAYAVGDGRAGTGVMDTGDLTRPYASVNTIRENAEILAEYVQSVRERTEAQKVDIVAHSMGGLISRQYIDSEMPGTEDPPVAHLVMLGTPNHGSPCALLLGIPSVYELRPDVAAGFNQRVTQRHGIPFSVAAGNVMSYTCQDLSAPGDFVVPVTSAQTGFADDTAVYPINHVEMTGSQALFDAWVVPHLVPGATPRGTLGNLAQPVRAPAASATEATGTQLLIHDAVTVPANGSTTVTIEVPATSELGVVHAAPAAITATLHDPADAEVSRILAGSAEAAQPFRAQNAANPAAGAWELRLQNTGSSQATVPVSAWVKSPQLTLTMSTTAPGADGRMTIAADLLDGSTGVPGATVTAELRSTSGLLRRVTLADDGASGDEAAGDGRYGATTGVLAGGRWMVVVRAEKDGAKRAVLESSSLPARTVAATESILHQREDPDTYETTAWIMRPDGAGARPMPHVGDQPAVSPDGDHVAYVESRPHVFDPDGTPRSDGTDIWVARMDGTGAPRRITNDPEDDAAPSWSPDGRRLAFSRTLVMGEPAPDRVAQAIWVADADGTNRQQVSEADTCPSCNPNTRRVVDGFPTWSPDGEEVAFVRYHSGVSFALAVARVDREGRTQLIAGGWMLFDPPAWGPDGRIAFAGESWDGQGINTIRPDDSGLRSVAYAQRCPVEEVPSEVPLPQPEGCGRQFHSPSWSPDATRLAYESDADGGHAIFVARVTGARGTTRITDPADRARQPEWSTFPVTVSGTAAAPRCADSSVDVEHGASARVALFCSDANGDPLTLEIVDGPQHGTLGPIDQDDDAVTYRPADGFGGADSFTFRASDGTLSSEPATVSITVAEPPPPPPPPTGGGGSPLTGGSGSGSGGSGSGSGGSDSGGGGSDSGGGGSGPSTGGNGECPPSTLICTIPVTCPAGAPASCNGDISNGGGGRQSSVTLAGTAATKALIRRTRFRVAPGKKKKVAIRLTKHGKSQLRKKRRLRVRVVVRHRIGTGPYTTRNRTITLRVRKPARRNRSRAAGLPAGASPGAVAAVRIARGASPPIRR